MSTGTFQLFDSALLKIHDGTINLATDDFYCALTTSAQTITKGTTPFDDAVYADLTDELPTANGYTAGGVLMTGIALTQTAGVFKLDCDDISWTAAGGSLTSKYFVIYSDTATNKDLLGFGLLNSTGADVTVVSTEPLTITIAANGLFTTTAA